jgi:hypothetical protein
MIVAEAKNIEKTFIGARWRSESELLNEVSKEEFARGFVSPSASISLGGGR